MNKLVPFASVVFVLALSLGCGSQPSRIEAPAIDPEAASQHAMELYDADKDGKLSEGELEKCPAILSAMSIYDTNTDKSVTADEIAARLQRMLDERNGLLMLHAEVLWNSRPLAGALVKFIPEAMVADSIKPAQGQTDASGRCTPAVSPEDSPTPGRAVQAMQPGLYRVEITHPTQTIPAKYNADSELGVDVSYRQMDTGIKFGLTSR